MLKKIIRNFIPWIDVDKKIYKLYTRANRAIKRNNRKIAEYYTYKIFKKYNCYIAPSAEIGKNISFPHPVGIVIGEGVKIGNNCVIYQNVTLGRKNRNIAEYPIIGDNVIVYCNSTLIGNIEVGNDSIIGCNTVVMKSVNKNSICTGVVK